MRKIFTFLFLFIVLLLTFYGGYRFLFENRGIAVIPTSITNVSCTIEKFSPPVKIEIEEVKIPVDGGYKPLYTLFKFYDRNGTLVGYWNTTRNFKKGYFYFRDGFVVWSYDGVVEMVYFDYNLTERWWREIYKSVGGYVDFVLYALYADESHIFLLTANRHFATAKVQNYCFYWGSVEEGDIIERFCSDKELSQSSLLGGKVVGNKVYIITDNGLYLFTYKGELIKKKKIELSKIESFDVNEKYLAFVYPSGDKTSKLCVMTSNLKSQRCIDVKGKVEQLRLCENYLLLKIGNKVRVLEIEENS
ncbi:DUF5711 family protein [Thermococcus barophilus]|uniref:Uncharacterized protein n=1 Tax=Thermococcus barophilus (strain DSM 11836 / MP) TaxID=391623 RepID=F0LH78_THEBM|nr:DUF5711 family protein [Thermococcus barophilus]ADT83040.1 hypothetical protein TERMP_00062 [Thermococcus barophilus MP]